MKHKGSALVMTVAFLLLATGLAISFYDSASLSRQLGKGNVVYTFLRDAAQHAYVDVISTLQDDYEDENYNTLKSGFYTNYAPRTTTDEPMYYWSGKSISGEAAKTVSSDPRINVLVSSESGRLVSAGYGDTTYSVSHIGGAHSHDFRWARQSYNVGDAKSERWFDYTFHDRNYDEVETEDEADYLIRYNVSISDLDARHGINNNYAIQRSDDTWDFHFPYSGNLSSTEFEDWMSYQSYTHRFAKVLKNAFTTVQYTPFAGFPDRNTTASTGFPSDVWKKGLCQFDNDLSFFDRGSYYTSLDPMRPVLDKGQNYFVDRLKAVENIFRGTGFQFGGNGNNNDANMALANYGPAVSFESYIMHVKGHLSTDQSTRFFTPFSRSLLDEEHTSNTGDAGNPNCPWEINILTATKHTLMGTIAGFGRYVMHENYIRGSRATAHNTTTTFSLGRNYPFPAPLSLNSGKYVPIMGLNIHNYGVKGTPDTASYTNISDLGCQYFGRHYWFSHNSSGRPPWPGGGHMNPNYVIHHANLNDFWADALAAMWRTLKTARIVYNQDVNPTIVDRRTNVYDPECILSVENRTSSNPADMLADIEAEFLRVLGSSLNSADPQLLAHEAVEVGFGPDLTIPSSPALERDEIQQLISDYYDDYYSFIPRVSTRIPEHVETRNMEYLLNDLRMSFFGSDAFDFNKDGVAESTKAGWWVSGNSAAPVREWYWYYHGVPEIPDNSDLDWLTIGAWYKFDGTNWLRRCGVEWINVEDMDLYSSNYADLTREKFIAINKAFLQDDANDPIKPWSATGRYAIKRSNIFNVFVNVELYNLKTETPEEYLASERVYHMDLNRDGNLNDSLFVFSRDHEFKP